ncbi:MAG: phosphate ABC transporter permease subunit PstC [Oligoflexales bacterium]|nr:phosphate ABC transporter permease subunit PstC [Oligoflexales bacterium]
MTFLKTKESLIEIVLALCALVSVLTTIGIIWILGSETFVFFNLVSPVEFLFGSEWAPLLEPKSFGVLPLVCGSLLVTFGAALIALPIGIITALYLSEFSSEKMRNIFKPLLEILSGIPTVVYGYFALTFITPSLQKVFPETEVFNAASGAIVVGIMILPIIATLSDDAFQVVSRSLREAAFALGATNFEVSTQVVLPSALPRVLAAVILALSRAIGETMAVTLAAGATPKMTFNPLESIQTMTAYIVQVSLGDTPAGGIEYMTIFAVGTLLFVMTLFMNYLAQRLIYRAREKVS